VLDNAPAFDDEPHVPASHLPPDLERDLEFAIEAAELAGARALALRASGRWKESNQLADVADHAADGLLQGFVRGRFPHDGILSEETADSQRRLSIARTWIIDPLDGTREYSQLREDWAVHVGLAVGGRCRLGALALPARGKVLWGVCEAEVRVHGMKGTGALVSGDSPAPARPRIAVSRSHTPSWMPRFAEILGADLVHSGSVGNKVGMLLLGEADLYAHRRGLNQWDTCAPECVARALGWSVSHLDGSEIAYNVASPHVDQFLVCRPAARERVLAALREAGVFGPAG
jgi:3'(2'), 5'-bisphosphate nucleotidase